MLHHITICMGSSCFARGNERNVRTIQEFIHGHGIEAKVELTGSRCQNCCANGPRMLVDGVPYEQVDWEKLTGILNRILVDEEPEEAKLFREKLCGNHQCENKLPTE